MLSKVLTYTFLLLHIRLFSTKTIFVIQEFELKDSPNITKILYLDPNLKDGLTMHLQVLRKLTTYMVI